MTTALHVVQPPDYGCPPWCEVGADHPGNDGRRGPFWHHADRCVPYRAAEQFIAGGARHRNPLGVDLERTGDGPLRIVLSAEDEPRPVLLELTVPEAAALARALLELTGLARRGKD
jgi:hypothetical protein